VLLVSGPLTMSYSRVKLADIPALTLYNDEPTLSRRGQPFPQLVCKGKPCNLFTPDVIRCVNVGGEGTNVDWKCETDLPESLRLGRVQMSCEGWSGPGDSYVLKESCSLEYRLQEVPNVLKTSTSHVKSPASMSTLDILFLCLCVAVLAGILYKFLLSCYADNRRGSTPRTPRPGPSSGSGWFPGSHNDRRPPPPPYSKFPDNTTESPGPVREGQGRLGFWGGAALGSLGTYLLTRQRNQEPQQRRYDWESERYFPRDPDTHGSRASGASSRQPSWSSNTASSSNLGSMRRSTGFGGSTVR